MTHADANTGEVVDNQVPIETVVFDISIYPRAEWSSRTVERYADALRAGEALPAITLESETNRLLDVTGRQQTSVGKRRCELVRAGLAADTGQRRASPSGSPAIVWALTIEGRQKAAAS